MKLSMNPISVVFLVSLSLACVCVLVVGFRHRDYDDSYSAPPPPPPPSPASYSYNPYSFGYDIEDQYGNKQWRQEKSQQPQSVQGSYGYRDKQGVYREVYYVADKNGFRASIKTNEPGTAPKDPASVRMDAYPSPYLQVPAAYASTRHAQNSYSAQSVY